MKRDFLNELKSIIHRNTESRPVNKVAEPRRFNIHKRSLPPGLDQIAVYNVETEAEALNLIEKARDRAGNRLFAPKLYIDDSKQSKTYIFYEPVPSDATPKERSIFYNKGPITKGE